MICVFLRSLFSARFDTFGRSRILLPVVFVIPSPTGAELGSDELEQKIIGHCRVNLPDFKVVRSVHVVEELPRSTLEKIAKNVLRDRLPEIEE